VLFSFERSFPLFLLLPNILEILVLSSVLFALQDRGTSGSIRPDNGADRRLLTATREGSEVGFRRA